MSGISDLIAEMTGQSDPHLPRARVEKAVVAATAPFTVTWQGQTVSCPRLASYTPVTGHVVAVLVQPPSLLVLGQII